MCQVPFHNLFLRIVYSATSLHKAYIQWDAFGSKDQKTWLQQQGNLLSHLIRTPEIIHGSGWLDLVTQQNGSGPKFFPSLYFSVHPPGFTPWLTAAIRSPGFLIDADREKGLFPTIE